MLVIAISASKKQSTDIGKQISTLCGIPKSELMESAHRLLEDLVEK
jgi:hypothetical protein